MIVTGCTESSQNDWQIPMKLVMKILSKWYFCFSVWHSMQRALLGSRGRNQLTSRTMRSSISLSSSVYSRSSLVTGSDDDAAMCLGVGILTTGPSASPHFRWLHSFRMAPSNSSKVISSRELIAESCFFNSSTLSFVSPDIRCGRSGKFVSVFSSFGVLMYCWDSQSAGAMVAWRNEGSCWCQFTSSSSYCVTSRMLSLSASSRSSLIMHGEPPRRQN